MFGQSKGDLKRAEEYYSRAILADPKDGDVLSQYAKLVWELHRDQDRAVNYFERAVHVAPEDRFVSSSHKFASENCFQGNFPNMNRFSRNFLY